MAGIFGEINSRADYYRVLAGAADIVRGILARTPNNGVMLRIQKELEAMKRWSAGTREPSEDERNSIDLGLIAAREFEGATGILKDLANKLFALNNYLEAWPTDLEAASAIDDDFDNE
jgi:hypothetical protein